MNKKLVRVCFFIYLSFVLAANLEAKAFKDNSEEVLFYNTIKDNFKNENFFEAHRDARLFIKNYPNSIRLSEIYYYLGETEQEFFKSIFYFRKVTNDSPSSYWATLSQLSLALKYYALGNYKKSEDELKIFIMKYPDSKDILKAKYFRALSFIQLKEFAKAKTLLNELSLKEGKWKLKSKLSLAHVYYLDKEYSKAIDIYSKVENEAKDNSTMLEIYEKLGLSFMKSGDKKKGIETFQKLISQYPNSSQAKKIKEIYFR